MGRRVMGAVASVAVLTMVGCSDSNDSSTGSTSPTTPASSPTNSSGPAATDASTTEAPTTTAAPTSTAVTTTTAAPTTTTTEPPPTTVFGPLLEGVTTYSPGLLLAEELPLALRGLAAIADDSDAGKFLLPICGANSTVAAVDGAFRMFGMGTVPAAMVDIAAFADGAAVDVMGDIVRRGAACESFTFGPMSFETVAAPALPDLDGIDEVVVVHATSTVAPVAQDRYEAFLRRGPYIASFNFLTAPDAVSDDELITAIVRLAAKLVELTPNDVA